MTFVVLILFGIPIAVGILVFCDVASITMRYVPNAVVVDKKHILINKFRGRASFANRDTWHITYWTGKKKITGAVSKYQGESLQIGHRVRIRLVEGVIFSDASLEDWRYPEEPKDKEQA